MQRDVARGCRVFTVGVDGCQRQTGGIRVRRAAGEEGIQEDQSSASCTVSAS
mgnify:CR=1 FL=1